MADIDEFDVSDVEIQQYLAPDDLRDGVNELSEGFLSKLEEIGSITEPGVSIAPRKEDPAQGSRLGHPLVLDDDTVAEESFPELRGKYVIHAKIGEGTYSSVYFGRRIPNNAPIGWWEANPLSLLERPTSDCFAFKRVYSTSSLAKICAEINLLKKLGFVYHGSWSCIGSCN
jgi:hypothetical protein